MRQTEIRAVFEIILYFALVACITFLIIHFVGQRTVVNGVSMQPTLSDGDNLIVDKLSYRFHDPDRFDIIVFPQEDGRYFIKRIIGLPGETVQILDGSVYINGEKLEEHYGNEVMEEAGIAAEPVTLGVDEYFVLGDNRNNSKDSRELGQVPLEEVLGGAVFRFWPMDKFGSVHRDALATSCLPEDMLPLPEDGEYALG